MDISISSGVVSITGNIKSVNDFQSIKQAVDSIRSSSSFVIIDVLDSISITSSVIGYLNKLVLKDSVDLNMKVGNEQLFHLLEDLNLTGTFKVKRR